MKLDLQLPSREVVEVEVEYEKLGKHCFFCKSLTDEDSEKHRCPLSRGHTEDKRTLGITQQNTLERIEEGRRRQEERRYSRFPNLPARKEARWTNSRNANREIEISSREYSPRSEMGKSLNFEENRRRYDDRHLAYRYSTSRETQSQHDSHERISTSRRTQDYKVKESTGPAPPRQSQVSPAREAISSSHRSPVAAPTLEQRRRNLDSRLSDPRSGNLSTEERISTKERLSVNTRRTSGSERTEGEAVPHQDKNKLPISPSSSTRTITAITRPSSSTIFETGRLGICERSPIRTLSEDRIHVSLRLGPLREDEENEEDNTFDLQLQQTLSSKAAGKKVATQTKDKKRPARNSPQGFPVKRRRTTKAHPSPRRKLMMDAITAGWDVEAIRETLPHYENFIRRLIPSALQAPDELVWLPNASGEYTTKSVETELHVLLKCPFAAKVWDLVPYAAWNPSTWNCGIGWLLRDADNAVTERSSSYWRYVP
ncbi:hypothetical protein HID58_073759, partial [Brassica napus]